MDDKLSWSTIHRTVREPRQFLARLSRLEEPSDRPHPPLARFPSRCRRPRGVRPITKRRTTGTHHRPWAQGTRWRLSRRPADPRTGNGWVHSCGRGHRSLSAQGCRSDRNGGKPPLPWAYQDWPNSGFWAHLAGPIFQAWDARRAAPPARQEQEPSMSHCWRSTRHKEGPKRFVRMSSRQQRAEAGLLFVGRKSLQSWTSVGIGHPGIRDIVISVNPAIGGSSPRASGEN